MNALKGYQFCSGVTFISSQVRRKCVGDCRFGYFRIRREFRSSQKLDDSALIVLSLGLGGAAVAGRYTYIAFKEIQETRKNIAKANTEEIKIKSGNASSGTSSHDKGDSKKEVETKKWFSFSWFKNPMEKRFYDGGFEENMSRREAALILGVRESTSVQRIKDAHRRILMLNHPDKGGSTYMAGKINEAKEILLKNREG